jgi:hypothetical protein
LVAVCGLPPLTAHLAVRHFPQPSALTPTINSTQPPATDTLKEGVAQVVNNEELVVGEVRLPSP